MPDNPQPIPTTSAYPTMGIFELSPVVYITNQRLLGVMAPITIAFWGRGLGPGARSLTSGYDSHALPCIIEGSVLVNKYVIFF